MVEDRRAFPHLAFVRRIFDEAGNGQRAGGRGQFYTGFFGGQIVERDLEALMRFTRADNVAPLADDLIDGRKRAPGDDGNGDNHTRRDFKVESEVAAKAQ